MEQEFQFREELNEPLIQVINTGLFDHKIQIADFFRQVSSEQLSDSPLLMLLDELRGESENVLCRYADYILGFISTSYSGSGVLPSARGLSSKEPDEVSELKIQINEKDDQNRRLNIQNDFLKGQLERREKMLAIQRQLFLKELQVLKEQLFQKARIGEPYVAEKFDNFNPEEWLDKLLGKGGMDEDSMKKKIEEMMQKLTARFSEERKKLESQIKILEREKNSKVAELEKEYKLKIAELENQISRLTLKHIIKYYTQFNTHFLQFSRVYH
ncbi:MAG: hypothetical protein EZS28_032151, partial [Streblomastix strix]